MNYQEFRTFREQVTSQQSLLRLDCMNPFKAMNFLKKKSINLSECSGIKTLDVWAKTMNVEEYKNAAIISGGVRESLKGLFKIFAANNKELWLPQDVYPFYWDTAHNAGLKPRSFSTLPTPDIRALNEASRDSVILITSPISPLGRTLGKEETAEFKQWLQVSKDRQIILDTVYSYARGFDKHTIALLETGQCFIAHSLSKAWLERGVFGVLLAPQKDRDICRNTLIPPSAEACSSAFMALEKQNDLSDVQQEAFSHEWNQLTPAIREFAPNFEAPKTGYFAAIEVNHKEVLKRNNALVIPGTVFGSDNNNISIISCLYNIS